MRVLLALVDDDLLAVRLDAVREVLPLPPVTPLPTAPAGVLGLLTLRGAVLPVLDTATLLGRTGAPGTFGLVVEVDGEPAVLTMTGQPGTGELDAEVEGEPGRPGRWHLVGGRLALLVDPGLLVTSALAGGPP